MRVAVDLMGADRDPPTLAEGAFDAGWHHPDLDLLLLVTASARDRMEPPHFLKGRVRWIVADEVIRMDEQPLIAVRRKPGASLVTGMRLLASGEVDAFVSAGNTGAAVTSAALHLGCLPPITRPVLALPLPSRKGQVLLLDVGANVDCRPEHFLQFAILGACYAEAVLGIEAPKVALLNIGEEAVKGSASAKEAYGLLQRAPIRFTGNIEGRDIFGGEVDVVVTDGFVGNIVLKSSEGVGSFLWEEMKGMIKGSLSGRLAAFLLRSSLKRVARRLDWREYGGAPLLGVKGVCIIAHGASDNKALSRAIAVARQNVYKRTVQRMEERLRQVSLTPFGATR